VKEILPFDKLSLTQETIVRFPKFDKQFGQKISFSVLSLK
jgi:hypothetical protein